MTAELLTTEAFLTIGDHPVTLKQAVRYLQNGRKLEGFLSEILKQFVLEQELRQTELQVDSSQVEQAVIDFRLQKQLADPKAFQSWLANSGLTAEEFHQQISYGFRLQKLKEAIAESKLADYFIERKLHLDRAILSRIIVADKELADELKSQLADGAAFEQLAREYSLTEDRIMNGMVGPVSLATMPELLRATVSVARAGDVIGPLGMDGRWGLFRVEEFLPASLDNSQIQQALQEELFDRWLAERMQNLPVRVQTGN